MKCRFCQSQTLPISKLDDSYYDDEHISVGVEDIWECLVCPHPVRQSDYEKDWYSILCYHKDRWYEVIRRSTVDEGRSIIVKCYTVARAVNDGNGRRSGFTIDFETVVDIPKDVEITPENVEKKLTTMLVFS